MPPVSISVYSFSIFNVGYATVHADGKQPDPHSMESAGEWTGIGCHIYSVALLPAGSARH